MQSGKKRQIQGKKTAIPSLWHKADLSRQAELEELRQSILERVDNALKSLEKKYHWDEVYLFGSVAQKGKFRRNSDVDIAISGLNKLEHYAYTGDISLLLDMRVDVVLMEECPFAKSITETGLKWNHKRGF